MCAVVMCAVLLAPETSLCRAKAKVSTSTTSSSTTTTQIYIEPVVVKDILEPVPFWKAKPKLYQSLIEDRQIICSAKTDVADEGPKKGLYQLNVVTAGLVNTPIYDAWNTVRNFESLAKVDERFQEVKYFAENQRVFLHMAAYGYHAKMLLQMRFGESMNAREMRFECVEGNFKGMTGTIRLEATKNNKTEFSMTTDYASEKIPLPKILLGIGVEVIGSRVAVAMRTYVEAEYKRASKVK